MANLKTKVSLANLRTKARRLEQIKDEILDVLGEAKDLLRGTPEESRAKAYWLAHIRMALDKDHSFLGGSMCTMQDTIDELIPSSRKEEDDQ